MLQRSNLFPGLTVGLLAAAAILLLVPSSVATVRPNIVFVLFDDIGYGQPPSYRAGSEFTTPNIDRLAREGMRFTDAHSAAANCTPTRYGVLTGRFPSRIGQFGVLQTYSPPIIPKERLTVASFLQRNGYHTACVGKWHLGLNWITETKPEKGHQDLPVGLQMKDGPNTLGFDYFFGFTHARGIESIIEQDTVVRKVAEVENQPLMIRKALEYLDERAKSDQPFFLYFPMCPPHNPVVPAPEFRGKSGVTGKEAKYGDWVYQGDHMLGQILDRLERRGLADNTLVIATGDNGAAGRPYAPLRAAKSSIYEGGHREPFIARWPGRIKAGSTCDQTVCLNDFFATCADILDVRLPNDAAEDSFSLLPLFEGKTDKPVREAVVHQAPGGLAIRRGDWKLVFHRSGQRELFNLREDISETTDVMAANADVAGSLLRLMQSYIDRGRSAPGPKQANDFEMILWDGKTGAAEKKPRNRRNRDKNRKTRGKAGAAK